MESVSTTTQPENLKKLFTAFNEGDYNSALQKVNDILKLDPTNPTFLLYRAACSLELDLYRKVIQDCDEVIKINPNLERVYLLKCRALIGLGKKKEAHQVATKGMEITNDLFLYAEMGKLLKEESSSLTTTTSSVTKSQPTSTALVTTSVPDTNLEEDKEEYDKMVSLLSSIQVGDMNTPNSSGNEMLDKFVAYGNFFVNSGKTKEAIHSFTTVIKRHPDLLGAYIGRGTAYALGYQLDSAVRDFTEALRLRPGNGDVLKRRGQCYAALGEDKKAIQDYNQAIKIDPNSPDGYNHRAHVYHKSKNWVKAAKDFQKITTLLPNDPQIWNYLGVCLESTGKYEEAIVAHKKALDLNKDLKEVYCNLGLTYKNWGRIGEAVSNFTKALDLDKTYWKVYHLRGFTYYQTGQHSKSIQDMLQSINYNQNHADSHIMLALAYQTIGSFTKSIKHFDLALKIEPDNPVWYQREIALWWHSVLDMPNEKHNMDLDLDDEFKEHWCKRQPFDNLKIYKHQPRLNTTIPDIKYSNTTNQKTFIQLLQYTAPFGKLFNQNSSGYFVNHRQHRMAGLATLHAAQVLRDFWAGKLKKFPQKFTTDKTSNGQFTWRCFYDIIVRWRQFSEPNDPVWWVDLLTPEQFEQGFGAQTPMITGQCNVARYAPMTQWSIDIMKKLMPAEHKLSPEATEKVEKSKTVADLYDIIKHDFWVTTPCYSLHSKTDFEGTRLTIQRSEPDGYEFTIRTPGTPPRWKLYEEEMTYFFQQLTEAAQEEPMDQEKVSDLILYITYYWYNFMPLVRGTAACGYIGLVAMFMAAGIQLEAPIPKDYLVDWQGILRPHPDDFKDNLKSWIYPGRKPLDIAKFTSIPRVHKIVPNLRTLITILNVEI